MRRSRRRREHGVGGDALLEMAIRVGVGLKEGLGAVTCLVSYGRFARSSKDIPWIG